MLDIAAGQSDARSTLPRGVEGVGRHGPRQHRVFLAAEWSIGAISSINIKNLLSSMEQESAQNPITTRAVC
jgi:hypothetical protein